MKELLEFDIYEAHIHGYCCRVLGHGYDYNPYRNCSGFHDLYVAWDMGWKFCDSSWDIYAVDIQTLCESI